MRKTTTAFLVRCFVTLALIAAITPACSAQSARTASPATDNAWTRDLAKYPGLLVEMGEVVLSLEKIEFPAGRTQSALLPLLPKSTFAYAAFSNYGGVAGEALKVLRQALKEKPALREWWQHGETSKDVAKALDALERAAQFHGYLGEELLVSAALDGKQPRVLLLAHVRKPGLKEFLQQTIALYSTKTKSSVRVLEMDELSAATTLAPGEDLAVLVRPDYVLAATDLPTLRDFNTRLAADSKEFIATPFGQRAVEEYRNNLTFLGAVDLREILNQVPPAARQDATFQSTGFSDLKYFIWEHKDISGKFVSQSELSFTAPRRGMAGWLSNSRPLGSLDFVSPKAITALTLALKDPAKILDELIELTRLAKNDLSISLAQLDQAMQLNLRNDVLAQLTGEITMEFVKIASPLPEIRASLGLKDMARLQATFEKFFAAAQLPIARKAEGGVEYSTLTIPQNPPLEICYAFVDGYLVMGTGRATVVEAVNLHKSGGSLAKSAGFRAALPPGSSTEASAFFYQNAAALGALQLMRMSPELAHLAMSAMESDEVPPLTLAVYGEEMAIRQATTHPAFNTGAILVGAAIAIPNLLRARITANETTAVGSLRTINVVQVQYSAEYPQRGFAPNLATLGPSEKAPSADRADLLDGVLANASCTGETWCSKSGYNFRITATCKAKKCSDYLAVATPITPGTTGARSFCSTSDGIIRLTSEPALPEPFTTAACKKWPPLS